MRPPGDPSSAAPTGFTERQLALLREGGLRWEEPEPPLVPVACGHVEVGGVRTWWERYGEGGPALLLMPPWSIVPSRNWSLQVPHLARHFTVVVYDARGNGRSDRPADPEAYATPKLADDALAVMDAAGVEDVVTVSLSLGTLANLVLATGEPRVRGAVFVGPLFPVCEPFPPYFDAEVWRELPSYEGWDRYNANHWREDHLGFAAFWAAVCLPERHSTIGVEKSVSYARGITPEALVASLAMPEGAAPTIGTLLRGAAPTLRALAEAIRCPTLVVSGDLDAITPTAWARELAEATGGRLEVFEGGGHVPNSRAAPRFNLLVQEWVEDLVGRDRPVRARATGAPRALFVSSPVGLGHAHRDVAIARELRELVPELEIEWLAQDPVTRVLGAEGERIHPASAGLARESDQLQRDAGEHELNVFESFRRMDELFCANFMLFHDAARDGAYDLWIADEGWEVDYWLHEHPELKAAPFAWLTDFVGMLPVEEDGERERWLIADRNEDKITHIAAHPEVRDVALYVGELDDVVDERFGPGLPHIREWVSANLVPVGYVLDPRAERLPGRAELREELGWGADERVCVVTVGGSGIGAGLLRRAIDAYPLLQEEVPGLRMTVVAGPRIDAASLPAHDGVEVLPYVHHLHRRLAACDVAVVQGGLATTMELTAAQRPFVYVPLERHFEQQVHVPHRLDRYRAGRRAAYADLTPEALAKAIAGALASPVDPPPVGTDGARRAAEQIAALL